MKQQTTFSLTISLIFASFIFFSCSKNNDALSLNADDPVHTSGTVPPNYTTRINIERNSFDPSDVTVMQNGSLVWVNNDNQVHSVTADDGSFDSGDIQAGGTFGFTFTIIGPHSYHCKYHNEATGIVKCVTK